MNRLVGINSEILIENGILELFRSNGNNEKYFQINIHCAEKVKDKERHNVSTYVAAMGI